MNKKYKVRLTSKQRTQLIVLIRRGVASAYRIRHAGILLKVDVNGPAWTDESTAEAYHCHVNTVRNVRQRFVEAGFDAAVGRRANNTETSRRKLNAAAEAALLSTLETLPPQGKKQWTLQALAQHLIDNEIVDSIHPATVLRTLARNSKSSDLRR